MGLAAGMDRFKICLVGVGTGMEAHMHGTTGAHRRSPAAKNFNWRIADTDELMDRSAAQTRTMLFFELADLYQDRSAALPRKV